MQLRSHPYPYRSMLAICSDLDETPDAESYFEISRFLNTRAETRIGTGVGLEIGNTLYFKMPDSQFSFYNCTDSDRERITTLIHSGHIDCLHSFGDQVVNRSEVIEAWRELEARECKIEVWIDHAEAKSNFDQDIMFGEGALTDRDCYHADVSLKNGIRFVWKGRVTSVIAKEAPLSLSGIFRLDHPLQSIKTLLKEAAKIALGFLGSTKYRMHSRNELLTRTKLLSGQPVTEFIRTNPSYGGVSCHETADGIAEVLTDQVLKTLVTSGGTSIFYTHLGKTKCDHLIPQESTTAFRRLASYEERGEILVTTTRRLLGFVATMKNVTFSSSQNGPTVTLKISSAKDQDLSGLSFYIEDSVEKVVASINGGTPLDLLLNPKDHTGQKSASIPWTRLEYPLT